MLNLASLGVTIYGQTVELVAELDKVDRMRIGQATEAAFLLAARGQEQPVFILNSDDENANGPWAYGPYRDEATAYAAALELANAYIAAFPDDGLTLGDPDDPDEDGDYVQVWDGARGEARIWYLVRQLLPA